MKNNKYIDWNQRLDEAVSHLKKKCKCGHTKIVPYSNKRGYVLCNWCGSRLYRDDKKQKEYDKRVNKAEFCYNIRKAVEKKEEHENKKRRILEKKNLKRKYFKNNKDYFKFCKNVSIKIYLVDTTTKSGNIVVYYGARLGRPPKNTNELDEYKNYKTHKHLYSSRGGNNEWRGNKEN